MTAIPWLLTVLQLFEGALRPLTGVVPPAGLTVSATSCAPCHAEVVAAWRQSAHADAFANSLFAASFKYERRAWCVSCHAPLPEQAAGRLRDEGVGCAACHVRGGAILAARPATAEAEKAHPIVVEPRLAQAELCAGCHQFNWPITMDPLRYGPNPMQNTVAEWQATARAETCVDCHMTSGHRMPGGHDGDRVARALDVAVVARPSQVRVRLRSHGVGHALPTGDPFRRLVVQLCAAPSCEPVLREVFFGRRFDAKHDGKLVLDTTVPPGGERVLDVAKPAGARYWRLVYRYAAIGTERDLDEDERAQEISHGKIDGGS
jgi:hypothetical protein